MNYQDVMQTVTKTEYAVLDAEAKLIIIYSKKINMEHGEESIKRMYKILDNGEIEVFQVNAAINEIIEGIKGQVNLVDLLKQVLKTSPPEEIVKALELLRNKAPVKIERGCFQITIGKGKNSAAFALRSA